jgi:hypothetical protein
MKTSFARQVIDFYASLHIDAKLPKDIHVLHPQLNKQVQAVIKDFFTKYYADKQPRALLFGINPGRFGAGVTGINFTAPKQLSENCAIPHPFGTQTELSAEFIYEVIEQVGGAATFYSRYFLTSVCPLGFTKANKNLNYYDDAALLKKLMPFITNCLQTQLSWNVYRQKCICIGGEKNYAFFNSLNQKYNWFKEIIPLPHPRFIMQYRRKDKEQYIDQYIQALDSLLA